MFETLRFTAWDVATWLRGLSNIKNVQPCVVGICKTDYQGCRYTDFREYTADMRAVVEGRKQAGDSYFNDRFFLLGSVPPSYRRRPKPVYVLGGLEWYVSSYYDKGICTAAQQFGNNFMLGHWNLPEPIDHYDKAKRPRKAITVRWLRFQVIEYLSFFAVRDTETGQEHPMSDGVDVLFDLRTDEALSPGSEGFCAKWAESLNSTPDETLECYFPTTYNQEHQ